MTEERRQHPRFVVENLFGKMAHASQVEVLNMSLSGAAVRVDRRLNIGTEYVLRLELSDDEVQVKGVVVWSMLSEIRTMPGRQNASVYTAGLRFIDTSTAALQSILDFVQESQAVPDQPVTGMRFHIQSRGEAVLDYPEGYRVKSLSLAGMLIETERDVDIEGTVPMEVFLPDGPPMTFSGRIVSSEESLDEVRRFELGIEFLDISPADQVRLSKYLDTL